MELTNGHCFLSVRHDVTIVVETIANIIRCLVVVRTNNHPSLELLSDALIFWRAKEEVYSARPEEDWQHI